MFEQMLESMNMGNNIDLTKLEELALIANTPADREKLAAEVSAVMDFVDRLRRQKTEVAPLFHPSDLKQRLQSDEVKESNSINALAAMAPSFADGLYLVPKIID